MTHHIQHQYDEILHAALPGLEIHVVYNCESEISFDEEGNEHTNRLLEIDATVNGLKLSHDDFKFPREIHGAESRNFIACLRESARQALWAKALEIAGAWLPVERGLVAERWMRTGSTKMLSFGKPQRDFVI